MKVLQSGAERGQIEIDVEQVDGAYRLSMAFVEAGARNGGSSVGRYKSSQAAGPLVRKEGKVLDTMAERISGLLNCRLGCVSEAEGSDTYWIEIPGVTLAASRRG